MGIVSEVDISLKEINSVIVTNLLPVVGPLAHLMAKESLAPILKMNRDTISTPHIISALRILHGLLPESVDRKGVIKAIRNELLRRRLLQSK